MWTITLYNFLNYKMKIWNPKSNLIKHTLVKFLLPLPCCTHCCRLLHLDFYYCYCSVLIKLQSPTIGWPPFLYICCRSSQSLLSFLCHHVKFQPSQSPFLYCQDQTPFLSLLFLSTGLKMPIGTLFFVVTLEYLSGIMCCAYHSITSSQCRGCRGYQCFSWLA